MTQSKWQAVCQYCGQKGAMETQTKDAPPARTPVIAGKCKSHPSGNKDAAHGPVWERR